MIFRDFPRIYSRGFLCFLIYAWKGKTIERKENFIKKRGKKVWKIQSGGKKQGIDSEH